MFIKKIDAIRFIQLPEANCKFNPDFAGVQRIEESMINFRIHIR